MKLRGGDKERGEKERRREEEWRLVDKREGMEKKKRDHNF